MSFQDEPRFEAIGFFVYRLANGDLTTYLPEGEKPEAREFVIVTEDGVSIRPYVGDVRYE